MQQGQAGKPAQNKPKNFSKEQVKQMRVMLRKNASYAEVGRRFNCNYKTVQRYVHGAEIHHSKQSKWGHLE
jgi:transposase